MRLQISNFYTVSYLVRMEREANSGSVSFQFFQITLTGEDRELLPKLILNLSEG